ncbi:MAG: SAP domain-containing protein, partial [Psychrobacter sp.]|nr:SAP domain-containing protein [Psychrobacter sp.]
LSSLTVTWCLTTSLPAFSGWIGLPLTKNILVHEFKQRYYDKKELMAFCRLVGISTVGLKSDLNTRIEQYLNTGQITAVKPKKFSIVPDSQSKLSPEKIVVNYKSDLSTRRFFEKNLPEFTGFSALVQKQIKQRLAEGEVFTYGDVLNMHRDFLTKKALTKAEGKPTKVAHNACQFNQFSIDYSYDPSPKVHRINDAWRLVRDYAGDKTYQAYRDRIEKIRIVLKR